MGVMVILVVAVKLTHFTGELTLRELTVAEAVMTQELGQKFPLLREKAHVSPCSFLCPQ